MSEVFPKWTNRLPVRLLIGALLLTGIVVFGVTYYFTPKYTRVGYQPRQPMDFSHAVHVKQLGMDCRYCHHSVEKSWYSSLPSTSTCMNCHGQILKNDPRLAPLRASAANGKPIAWVQLHKLPDYVYFNHAVHVNRGVSCVECHGRVDTMDQTSVAKPLSMAFCLDCHRNHGPRLRPLAEITHLDWTPPTNEVRNLQKEWKVETLERCSTCHR